MEGKKLFVGNINYDAKEEELAEVFRRVGKVISVRMPTVFESGRKRGFAFVEMSSEEEAVRAVRELSEVFFMGRPLIVAEAKQTVRPRK